MRRIRITSPPPGEAPLSVRQAWVGCVIPLATVPYPQPKRHGTDSLFAGRPGLKQRIKSLWWRQLEEQPQVGYVVEVLEAINELVVRAPEAAEWWRRSTPHLFHPGQHLLFAAFCCEELSDSEGP